MRFLFQRSNFFFYHIKVEKMVDGVEIHQVPATVSGGNDDLNC